MLMPATLNYFTKLLSVVPLTSNLKSSFPTLCGLTMPANLTTGDGVASDLHIFVTGSDESSGLIAWARACMLDGTTGRPLFGQINFNYQYIFSSSAHNWADFQSDLSITQHELTHVLALSGSLYQYYVNPGTNVPLTNVLQYTIVNGNNVSYLNLPMVTDFVRNYFNCSTAYALIENEGSTASAGSHWERRIFFNEYMTASAIANLKITNLTLSLFVDSGWYQVDWSMAESISWGKNKGCDFIFTKCVDQTFQPAFPEFCGPYGSTGCTFDGRFLSYCAAYSNVYTSPDLPASMNYWNNNTVVLDPFADNCPYQNAFSNGDCTDPANSNLGFIGDYFGPGASCFYSNVMPTGYQNNFAGRCKQTHCIPTGNGNWVLQITMNLTSINCTAKGSVSPPNGYTGVFPCPDPNEFCNNQHPPYCPRACTGNGECKKFTNQNNYKCICNPGWFGIDCSNSTYPCAPNQYYSPLLDSCISNCQFPHVISVASSNDYCNWPCGSNEYYMSNNGSCVSSCPFISNGTYPELTCIYPCSANEYLYPNDTCLHTCEPPLIAAGNPNEKVCHSPCSPGEYLYSNGSCMSHCPSHYNVTYSPVLRCIESCHPYEWIMDGSCISNCSYPLVSS